MPQIDYFTNPLSTFAYLAGQRLEEIAARHGANITYKPFAISTVFQQTGGMPPAQRHPNRQAYRLQDIARVAQHVGLKINLEPAHWPTNATPACYAIIAAQNTDDGDVGGLVHGLLRAVWANDQDIALDAVIETCLEDNGFDPKLAHSGMLSGAATFEANTEEAVQRGVFGAPTYIVNEQVFWGQDRLDYLDQYLASL